MKIRQGTAIACSGIVWMGMGIFLLCKGFSLLLHPPAMQTGWIVPAFVARVGNIDQVSLSLITVGLFLGFIKGKFVLARTAKRVIQRILSLPNPVSIQSVYGRSYALLLLSMILLGLSFTWFSVPYDIRGIVDVAIGSALANGSAFYFRHFAEVKQKTQ